MKPLLALTALTTCLPVMANNWIPLAASDSGAYYGLAGSYEVRRNKSQEQIVVWTEKFEDRSASRISLQKLYVRTSDCLKKQGKGVVVNMDGDFKYEFDFIFGAGTVGSARAETLCGIFLQDREEANKKGI
jgi:hypothetical protein